MQLQRHRKPRAAEPTEGDLQLAEARQLQRRTASQQSRIDRITAAAEREAQGNSLARILYEGLLKGS